MRKTELIPLLLIEIGGTHTRCAVKSGDQPPGRVALFHNAEYADLDAVVAAYLNTLNGPRPRRTAIALAGPVDEPPVHLTNLGWTVDTARLVRRFDWSDVVVMNDFEALACAVPQLRPDELLTLQAGEPAADAPIAVLGPGTGLGVSGLVPCGGLWYPLSGEGGHVTLPVASDREAKLIETLRREHGHVSAERVLCGPGLLSLYRLLCDRPEADTPADVSRLANAGDRAALETVRSFCLFLGTVAADVALILGARGGVYLGGGILPALRGLLENSGFIERFTDKGRFSSYLESVPVHLITAETPALRGIAAHPRVAP